MRQRSTATKRGCALRIGLVSVAQLDARSTMLSNEAPSWEPNTLNGVKLTMADLHQSLRSIWPLLPIWPKFFLLILFLVAIYSIVTAAIILTRLRSLTGRVVDVNFVRGSLESLRARSSNLRQLIEATFLLWGFVFFLELPWATRTIDSSRTPTSTLILDNFLVDFGFALNVFFLLLLLHLVQWFVSARIHACARRLTASEG